MKMRLFSMVLTLLFISLFYLPNTYAQCLEIQYSPDGTRLAVASATGIRFHDAQTGKYLDLFTGHTSWVNSVSFSPDGLTLASGSRDSTVRLWDVATGDQKQVFDHRHVVNSVSFSPDGLTLASGGDDETIRLWDVATGDQKQVFTGHESVVSSVSFSPDGLTLASGSSDSTVRLWDVATGDQKQVFGVIEHAKHAKHENWAFSMLPWSVHSVSFSPDGLTLASGSRDQTVRLWNIVTGYHKQVFPGHTSVVHSVSFSPDGLTLASGSSDNTVRLWNVVTRDQKQVFTGHRSVVSSVSFSPDGRTLASVSYAGNVLLWELP